MDVLDENLASLQDLLQSLGDTENLSAHLAQNPEL
tara:strand:- start:523 stop:627 length:105 start_codon:yes stop_codon:yes gene_type:complete